MQRWIERTDYDRISDHPLEQSGEVGALHRQELIQSLLAGFYVPRQNHLLHVRKAVFGEEHVFGAAQADPLGSEFAGNLRVARNVRVGADTELAAKFIRPAHKSAQIVLAEIGFHGFGVSQVDVASGAVEREYRIRLLSP